MADWFDEAISNSKAWAEKAIADIGKTLASLPKVTQDLLTVIDANAKTGALFNFKVGDKLADNLLAKITKLWNANIAHGNDDFITNAVNGLVSAGLIDKAVGANLSKALKGKPVLGPIMVTLFSLIVPTMSAIWFAKASVDLGVQDASAAVRQNLPDASSVMQAAFIDNSTTKRIVEILQRSGIQDQDIKLLFKAQYATFNEGVIRDLYFRGVYDKNAVYKRLRENHYTDTKIAELLQTWTLIPPVNDLITMAVREAFSPEQIKTLGLDLDFPAEFAAWAAKQGLADEWSKRYWYSHWQLPSAQMGFEMLHRDLISAEELDALIKALDYSPTWRDRLKAISYNVMTRVDVRRLFQLGLLTADEMETKYRHMGYEPGDAKNLRKWTELEYNQDIKSYTKNAIIKAYLEGFLSEADATSYLVRIGFTQGRVEEILDMARYERGVAKRTQRVAALRRLYVSGQYNGDEVTADLRQYGIDDRVIAELIDTWNLEQKAGLKLPLARDLNDWLSVGAISDDDYKREMRRLGYSEYYVNLYYKAEKAKAANAAKPPVT